LINISLLAFLVVVAVAIIRTTDLFVAVMLFSIYSLLSASLFVVLDAGDVALTEAAVGTGISTVLMLAVLALARRHEHPIKGSPLHNLLALAVVLATGAGLVYASLDMPAIGAADNPAHDHVARYYIEQAYADTGVPNMVAAILASYRSIDTLGEVMVIFTAGLGVVALLSPRPRRRRNRETPDAK
jgi:multicomponent Na+:H+ antiporter subunit B